VCKALHMLGIFKYKIKTPPYINPGSLPVFTYLLNNKYVYFRTQIENPNLGKDFCWCIRILTLYN